MLIDISISNIDPQKWTSQHVQSWLLSTLSQFKLPDIHDMENVFPEDGEALFQLSEDEFIQRSPQVRLIIFI